MKVPETTTKSACRLHEATLIAKIYIRVLKNERAEYNNIDVNMRDVASALTVCVFAGVCLCVTAFVALYGPMQVFQSPACCEFVRSGN